MNRDHFDCSNGSLKALVARFDPGAIESLFKRLTGEDTEGVGDTGFLLRLTDSTSDLGVDRFVVGGFATEEAAESDDRVKLLRFGESSRGRGNLPGTGDTDDLDVRLAGTASEKTVEGSLEQAVRDNSVPTGGNDGEGHAYGTQIALDRIGAVVEGVLGLPET